MTELKEIVTKESTFDLLEIRVGKIIAISIEESSPKKAYKLEIDFGKFGKRVSVGRFTQLDPQLLMGKLVLGILNFEPRLIGKTNSEVLILGVQVPGVESGEATIVTTLTESKIGSKLF
jgi:tRNA-binding protein